MNEQLFKYIHTHTTIITCAVVLIFIALATGEFVLYKKVNNLNMMLSEGIMQMKEEQKSQTMMLQNLNKGSMKVVMPLNK